MKQGGWVWGAEILHPGKLFQDSITYVNYLFGFLIASESFSDNLVALVIVSNMSHVEGVLLLHLAGNMQPRWVRKRLFVVVECERGIQFPRDAAALPTLMRSVSRITETKKEEGVLLLHWSDEDRRTICISVTEACDETTAKTVKTQKDISLLTAEAGTKTEPLRARANARTKRNFIVLLNTCWKYSLWEREWSHVTR